MSETAGWDVGVTDAQLVPPWGRCDLRRRVVGRVSGARPSKGTRGMLCVAVAVWRICARISEEGGARRGLVSTGRWVTLDTFRFSTFRCVTIRLARMLTRCLRTMSARQ